MWIIKSLNLPETAIHLLPGHEYVVGRRDCDIVVPNDMSVSRKHAIIKVIYPEPNLSRVPVLQIKDVSKLGTVLRNERITNADTERAINSGDILDFGTVGNSKYLCVYEPLIVTTSCLDHAAKKSVKQLVCKLGGQVVSDWCDGCCLAVMSNLSVTVKVICALVSLKPIVTAKYLADLVASLEKDMKSPNPNEYLPPLAESQVNPYDVSFEPDERRRTLFKGKSFLFFSSSQLKKLCAPIICAGGTTQLIDDSFALDATFTRSDVCVMLCDAASALTDAQRNLVNCVQQLLAKHSLRMITEPEIGFAVLYCSVARYCNPAVSCTIESKAARLSTQSSSLPASALSQQTLQSAATVRHPQLTSDVHCGQAAQVAAVRVKEEPSSQTTKEPPSSTKKRLANTSDQGQQQSKRKRTEMSVDLADDGIHGHAQSPECEYSPSVKVESTFVCDSVPAVPADCVESAGSKASANIIDKASFLPPSHPVVTKAKASVNVFDNASDTVSHPGVAEKTSVEVEHHILPKHAKNDLVTEVHETIQRTQNREIGETSTSPLGKHIKKPIHNIQKIPVEDVGRKSKNVPIGFLTTALSPVALPRGNVSYEKDDSLPVGVVVVEERSLFVRNRRPLDTGMAKQIVVWQGRSVKNFKRFKKNSNHGVLSSHVIGRADLVAHSNLSIQQKEWFENGVKAESNVINTEKLSQELFSWKPPSRRK